MENGSQPDEDASPLPNGNAESRLCDAYRADKQKDLEAISSRMRHLVSQLIHGCGNSACKEIYCATGRRNINAAPVRDYTVRSARAIALMLLSDSNPGRHTCPHYTAESDIDLQSAVPDLKDPQSFTQQLSDTKTVQSLLRRSDDETSQDRAVARDSVITPRDQLLFATARQLTCLFEPPYAPSGDISPGFQNNHDAANILENALMQLTPYPLEKYNRGDWTAAAIQINTGHATSSYHHALSQGKSRWLEIMGFFSHEPCLQLCDRICEVVSYRLQLEGILKKHQNSECGSNGMLSLLIEKFYRIAYVQNRDGKEWTAWPYPLWFKKTFLRHWNGGLSLKSGTVEFGALMLLEIMQRIEEKGQNRRQSVAQTLPIVVKRIDAVEMAQTWLDNEGVPSTEKRHLLSFPFLFSEGQRLNYFRTVNHLRMRQTAALARTNDDLMARYMTTSSRVVEVALRHTDEMNYLRGHYFLLNVSRGDILQDTFDQLWQRRKGDLLRPLRVRLGELDGMEVGQDLGGVQIEFFNLVCMELFAEENGMFTTNPISGLSYFRPMSLQPLYMYELFGLLVALALYNGITIPASFPKALYRQILGLECNNVSHIEGDWPSDVRALRSIERGEVRDMDYAFPLEANGFRLSLSRMGMQTLQEETPGYLAGTRQSVTFKACELSLIDNPTPHLDLAARPSPEGPQGMSKPYPWAHLLGPPPKWPHWTVVPQEEPRLEHTVSSMLQGAYMADYVAWLTTYSVLPQLHAFRKGIAHLLSPHHLALFDPVSLKKTLEGAAELDVAALRSATSYSGFSPSEKYIEAFWRIVAAWPQAKQRALLKFVTAAERVPVAGNLAFRIEKSEDGGEGLLPTSSTCFGTLYLPVYEEVEGESGLEGKLGKAVEEGLGFGLG